jgi:multicomponent Na+:H+ antiporter subunit D
MAAGAVVHATGKRKLTELGGAIDELRWVWVFYMFGALSISGLPLLSGFVSKALVVYAAEIEHRDWMVILLGVASVGTFLSVGLKLPYFTWFGTKRSLRISSIPPGMYLAMALSSAINLAIGLRPELLYAVMPFSVEYRPYTAAHLLEALELLGFSGLAFWYFRSYMTPKAKISLDIDWLYRVSAPWFRRYVVMAVNDGFALVDTFAVQCARRVSALARNPLALLPDQAGLRPAAARRWKSSAARDYDPDRYRAPIGLALLIVLVSFISLLGWDLVSALLLP